MNEAVAAFGDGALRRTEPPPNQILEIGGSTGGLSRFLLDGCVQPGVESFLTGL